ncbi:hypothetical protein Ga0080559_TMP2092 [Salipiger profundus]|uniref:Uncharacterized protein n=1 Tax=Salipiger profundus TaxID=1229727 RepID=A0A1U7D458_9RHOB|nr:hypothetical protein Ga0080559_TMP2092 [Salipiger profundus]
MGIHSTRPSRRGAILKRGSGALCRCCTWNQSLDRPVEQYPQSLAGAGRTYMSRPVEQAKESRDARQPHHL